MDVETAVRRIKRQFGDEYGVIVTNDDLYGWIHDAELDIIRNTSVNETAIDVIATLFPVNVPDAVRIRRITVAGKALLNTTLEEIDMLALSDWAEGASTHWYMYNKQAHLWPTDATDARSFQITYVKTPVMMTGEPTVNTFTVPEVYHDDVIKYCLAKAHNKNNNTAAEKVHMDLYDRSVGIRRDESHTVDAPIYKAGDPMDVMY